MKIPLAWLRRSVAGNLRAQLILTTVAPVAVLLIALTIVGALALISLTQALVQDRDTELVQLAARQIADDWELSVHLLAQVASAEPIRAGRRDDAQGLLRENAVLQQRFDLLSVTNAQGHVIATEGGALGQDVGNLDYFERAKQLRRPVRSPLHDDGHGRRVITVAVPYFDGAGRFGGCVLGTWDLAGSQLGAPVASIRVGEEGYAFLVDQQGAILYHPDRSLLAAQWMEHPSVAAVCEGGAGAQTIRWRSERTIIAYAPVPLTQLPSSLVADESWEGWGLLTSQMWEDIVAPLQPYLILMLFLLLLALLLPLAFLALNSRRIVAPLQSLVAQAEEVAAGRFESRVSVDSGPTEVRELEEAFNTMVAQLLKYRNDIQNYVVSILNTQEQERKRVARELHDDTAQALVVLGRRIELATDLTSRQELVRELDELRDMVDDTVRSVRSFTRDLRPPLLEELGLPRSLQILGDRVSRDESLEVTVRIEGQPRQLLPEVELGLYRLAQESLSNVRRHAQATRATVELVYDAATLALRITDNGIGFEAPEDPSELVSSGRLGLVGIFERARLFGGKAEIESAPGRGTVITIGIPVTTIVLAPDDGIRP
ncbi:MAG: HAMP domain-containing protein [Chloroflexi bacterium]|nr:HAMP domain-containing protein [Chloroflexota bacterium]